MVREIISKVQTMRKEAGFEVTDHINLYQDENEKISEILKSTQMRSKARSSRSRFHRKGGRIRKRLEY